MTLLIQIRLSQICMPDKLSSVGTLGGANICDGQNTTYNVAPYCNSLHLKEIFMQILPTTLKKTQIGGTKLMVRGELPAQAYLFGLYHLEVNSWLGSATIYIVSGRVMEISKTFDVQDLTSELELIVPKSYSNLCKDPKCLFCFKEKCNCRGK